MTRKINLITVASTMAIAMIMTLSASTMAFAREAEPNDDRGGRESEVRLTDDNNKNKSGSNSLMQGEATQLKVEPNGKFSASGLVVNATSSAGLLNVKFFGINFNVRVANARVEGATATTTVSDIAVGDKLSIAGTIDLATGAISAERIVDHTLAARRTGDIQSRIADLMRMVEQLREQLRQLSR